MSVKVVMAMYVNPTMERSHQEILKLKITKKTTTNKLVSNKEKSNAAQIVADFKTIYENEQRASEYLESANQALDNKKNAEARDFAKKTLTYTRKVIKAWRDLEENHKESFDDNRYIQITVNAKNLYQSAEYIKNEAYQILKKLH